MSFYLPNNQSTFAMAKIYICKFVFFIVFQKTNIKLTEIDCIQGVFVFIKIQMSESENISND